MPQPQPFERTLRSLAADRHRRAVACSLVATALLAVWACWLAFARLPVYAVSREARLEVAADPHPIEAPIDGRVLAVAAKTGARVEAGAPLLWIDVENEDRLVAEERARAEGLVDQLVGARDERSRRADLLAQQRHTAAAELAEARARRSAAVSAAELAELEAERAGRLRRAGLISGAEAARLDSLAEQRRAEAEAASGAVDRLSSEHLAAARLREAELAAVDREVARLRAEGEVVRRGVERLRGDVERRTVRASVGGVIAEMAVLQAGSRIEAGERLATLLPDGGLRIVATFEPADALGRVAAGQPAEMRLDGFPWTEFGSLAARVERVAAEPRDDRVRAELVLTGGRTPTAPIRHGLPGTVLVEVERSSPWALVLRAVGRRQPAGPAS